MYITSWHLKYDTENVPGKGKRFISEVTFDLVTPKSIWVFGHPIVMCGLSLRKVGQCNGQLLMNRPNAYLYIESCYWCVPALSKVLYNHRFEDIYPRINLLEISDFSKLWMHVLKIINVWNVLHECMLKNLFGMFHIYFSLQLCLNSLYC